MKNKFIMLSFVVLIGAIGVLLAQVSNLAKRSGSISETPAPQSAQTTSTIITPPPPEDIPIMVQELIPESSASGFEINASSAEEAICCWGGFMADRIFPYDPDIKSKTNLNKYALIVGWTTASNSGPLHLYLTATHPGSECTYSDSGGSCPNPTLKVFNDEDNSVATIATNDFTKMMEPPVSRAQALYLKKDNAIVVMGRGNDSRKFLVYPSAPYPLKTMNTSSSHALLFGTFLVSFDSATHTFSIEDLASHDFNHCTVTSSEYQDAFDKYFDSDHVTISPNGTRVLIGGSKLIWVSVSDKWTTGSADCINDFKDATSNTPSGLGCFDLGQWFNNGNVFAVTAYYRDAFLFDFLNQYQSPQMLWSEGRGVGVFGNATNENPSGYFNSIDLGYKTYSIKTEINKQNSSVDVYLIHGYKTSFINRIYTTLVGPYGDRTSTWIRLFSDHAHGNLFHFLVLDGYTLREVLDVTIQS
jgi:hypothetical protein